LNAGKTVSIGVPTYNRLPKLQRSLPHVLGQDYGDIEVVVSDNASIDGTQEFCEELARRDPRVRYIRQPQNIGMIPNYSAVMQNATGELYMHRADDDDLAPTYVSKCVEALESDPSIVFAGGLPLAYKDGVQVSEPVRTNLLDPSPEERVREYYRIVLHNGIFHGIGRRRDLLALPPMRKVLAGDWLFIASIAFQGRIVTIEETTVIKHLGNTSATMASLARSLQLGPMYGRYGVESILYNVFSDIAWQSAVYEPLGGRLRLSLALEALVILMSRWSSRWSSVSFWRAALTDALLPADVKRGLIAFRDARRNS
jgi:glycosyltransferase involved in cell wall biosynthesis